MTNVENIYSFFNTYAEKSDALYLEAMIEAANEWLDGSQLPILSEDVTKEEIRRGIQLAILQGMKTNAQAHHQMTPDSIGMLIGYFTEKLMQQKERVALLDPAAGTGNLLYTVMNMIGDKAQASAVEIDDLLVRLSALSANLLEQNVTFLVQDALRPLFIDPVDLVVSDLPVGYYPDDDNGANYRLMPVEGHAYAHHLFIEQSLNHLKSGGYGIFVIPANLFESEHAPQLHEFLKQHSRIRAVIQLPSEIFRNSASEKSILIVQKPVTENQLQKEVLLAKVPSMSSKNAMAHFLQQFDTWIQETELK